MTNLYFSRSGPFWLFDSTLVPALKEYVLTDAEIWGILLLEIVSCLVSNHFQDAYEVTRCCLVVVICSRNHCPQSSAMYGFQEIRIQSFDLCYALLIGIGVDLLGWGWPFFNGRLILWFKYKYDFETLREYREKAL